MCEFDPRCDGPDSLVGNALDQISAGRWAVTAVYGDELGPPVAYTTGLTEFSRPELLITGLDPELAFQILNRAAELVIADEHLLEAPRLDGVLQPPHRLATLPAVDITDLSVTRLLYGPDVPVVQLIWPDADQRYPWEHGYAHTAHPQPLSGLPLPRVA